MPQIKSSPSYSPVPEMETPLAPIPSAVSFDERQALRSRILAPHIAPLTQSSSISSMSRSLSPAISEIYARRYRVESETDPSTILFDALTVSVLNICDSTPSIASRIYLFQKIECVRSKCCRMQLAEGTDYANNTRSLNLAIERQN
jgi:hypothetical protein